MQRQDIENALEELDSLIKDDVNDESQFQKWFESHPVILQALGYARSIAHPRIANENGEEWIPDFLCQNANRTWEVFELKTPQTSILLDAPRRQKFYASFDSYLKQCREYARLFDDPRTLDAFDTAYSVRLHKDLPITVVAGRSIGLDARKVHELSISTFPPASVLTYDDVRAHLEHYRAFNFGDYDKAKGLGIAFVLVLHRSPSRWLNNHIFDVGGRPDRDRVSVFLNPQGFLRLDVLDSNGDRHSARSALPLEGNDYDTPHLLTLSIGIGDGFGFLSIEIDQKYRADIRVGSFPFSVSDHYVLGSDITGTAPSWICIASLIVLARPLRFQDKAPLRHYAETYHIGPTIVNPSEPWSVFNGRQSLRSTSHPFPSTATGAPTFGPCPFLAAHETPLP